MSTNEEVHEGFEESIIIPLALYQKRCNPAAITQPPQAQAAEHRNISTVVEADTPSDVQLNLLQRQRWEKMQVGRKQQQGIARSVDKFRQRFENLKRHFASLGFRHPFLHKIIEEFIQPAGNQVNWRDDTYELILDGRLLPETNFARALHFLLAPEDLNDRMPTGAVELATKLREIGVPPGWLNLPEEEVEDVAAKEEAAVAYQGEIDNTRTPTKATRAQLALWEDEEEKEVKQAPSRSPVQSPWFRGANMAHRIFEESATTPSNRRRRKNEPEEEEEENELGQIFTPSPPTTRSRSRRKTKASGSSGEGRKTQQAIARKSQRVPQRGKRWSPFDESQWVKH